MRETVTIYRSFVEGVAELEDDVFKRLLMAAFKYGLDDVIPTDLKGLEWTVFLAWKANIDASIARKENGKKGGRPRKSAPVTETFPGSSEATTEEPIGSVTPLEEEISPSPSTVIAETAGDDFTESDPPETSPETFFISETDEKNSEESIFGEANFSEIKSDEIGGQIRAAESKIAVRDEKKVGFESENHRFLTLKPNIKEKVKVKENKKEKETIITTTTTTTTKKKEKDARERVFADANFLRGGSSGGSSGGREDFLSGQVGTTCHGGLSPPERVFPHGTYRLRITL